MKRFFLLLSLLSLCILTTTAQGVGSETTEEGNYIYVYRTDGGVDAYGSTVVDGKQYIEDDVLYIPLTTGVVESYTRNEYDSCSSVMPQLPTMTTFKFNNKYNPSLHLDVVADTVMPQMQFALNTIGKWLVPSFNLSDDRAVAYIDTVMQISKETHVNFADGATYVVTYPGYNKVANVKVKDEVWSSPDDEVEMINLTPDMLTTNKPSAVSGEGLDNLLDGNPQTIFHSTWGDANNATLYVACFITIDLPEAIDKMQLYYMTRSTNGYNPLEIEIYVSNDKSDWQLKRTLVADADGMPRGGVSQEYTSPTIDFGGSYRYVRIRQTAGEYSKNHMALAEMRLYKVIEGTGESVKLEDAVYEIKRTPFGNSYCINIDWLVDKATDIPRIDITVDGGYYQIHYNKDIYYSAMIEINGNGVYEDFMDMVNIKGRGNSTWSYPKKPYRLKFDSKRKPFGLTNGKSWVLLANYQRGSFLANAIAMKIGQLVNVPYTNHIVPVDLYMDGEYMGNYMFTEKVGFGNNSVDIDEDTGNCFMLELDEYYDEVYKFKSPYYNLPVNVKEPDLSEIAETDEVAAQNKFGDIKNSFNRFEEALYFNESIEPYIDLDAAARYMLANDLVLGQELGHPKSAYLWREDITSPNSKIILGPMWDYDWAYGYENNKDYCTEEYNASVFASSMYGQPGYKFYGDLTRHPEFKRYYYKMWKEFVEKGYIVELMDYIKDYYNYAKESFGRDANVWGQSYRYDQAYVRSQNWLKDRQNYLMSSLAEEDITDILYTLPGDVDCNNQLTVHDISVAADYIQGVTDASFNFVKADMDGNNRIEMSDIEDIASQVIVAPAVPSYYYYNTPVADAIIEVEDLEIETDENINLSIAMHLLGDDRYKALQADILLPVGMTMQDVQPAELASGHTFSSIQLDENLYRIMVYSDESKPMTGGVKLTDLTLYTSEIIPEQERVIEVQNILTVNEANVEERLGSLKTNFGYETSLYSLEADVSVRGGNCITISTLLTQRVDIYSVDGRLVRSIDAATGTTSVQVPAGVYIVKGHKVLVY